MVTADYTDQNVDLFVKIKNTRFYFRKIFFLVKTESRYREQMLILLFNFAEIFLTSVLNQNYEYYTCCSCLLISKQKWINFFFFKCAIQIQQSPGLKLWNALYDEYHSSTNSGHIENTQTRTNFTKFVSYIGSKNYRAKVQLVRKGESWCLV